MFASTTNKPFTTQARCRWMLLVALSAPGLRSQSGEAVAPSASPAWTPSELRLLKSLSIDSLPRFAADRRNPLAGDRRAAALGKRLFSDARLSGDGKMSCQSCHEPDRFFQDGRATGQGRVALTRNSPSLVGIRHRKWLYWDGRKDSLWAQALEPIESPKEMNGTRSGVARLILSDAKLRHEYERIFGTPEAGGWTSWPRRASPLGEQREREAWDALTVAQQRSITQIFVNVGKSIAAFEATLELPVTRFDRFVRALLSGEQDRASELLDEQEQRGLRRFVSGDAGCVSCHLGPRFTTDSFHNVGTGLGSDGDVDSGRFGARDTLLNDEFNCRSPWSTPESDCQHLDTLHRVEVQSLTRGAFLTPSLRNLVHTAPYMHDGRFATLERVLEHYRSPPDKSQHRHEIPRLHLSDRDVRDIIAFLKTLSAPHDAAARDEPGSLLESVTDS